MAAVQYVLAHLDFGGKGEIRNVVLGGSAIRPASPELGAIFFNSATNRVEYFDGSAWQTLAAEVFTEAAHDAHDHSAVAATIALNEIGEPTGAVSLAGQRITNLGTPSNSGDAANKSYVDAEVAAEAADRAAADAALDGRLTTAEADIASLETAVANLDGNYATDAQVTAAVAAEAALREAADSALQSAIDAVEADLATETADRQAADTALDGRVSTLETTVANLDGNYATDAEVSAAVAAEAALRAAADTALQGEIDAVETALAAETSARTAADTTLQGNIDAVAADLTAEEARATAAEAALQAAIDAVDSDLADENTARVAADAALQANIDAVAADLADEATARTAADVELDGRLDTVEATLPTLATNIALDAAIATEAARADAYADAAALAAENAAKAHAEALAQGLNVKEAVRAFVWAYPADVENGVSATTLPLAGSFTDDAIQLAAGDRILVNSSNPEIASGIYVVGATATVLAADWANDTNTTGSYVLVTEGTAAGTSWVFNPNSDNGFSTTGDWKQFAGTFNYEAMPGIQIVGRSIGVEPESLSTVLGFTRKVAATIGDGVATSFTITTGLDADAVVAVRDIATGQHVLAAVTTTNGSMTIEFAVAPAQDAYRVSAVGTTYVAAPEGGA